MTQRIVPMVAYEDAAAAIDWLTQAFGFREREGQRYTADDGTVTHAELERDGEIVMLATPNEAYQSPKRHRETCEAARRWQADPANGASDQERRAFWRTAAARQPGASARCPNGFIKAAA